MMSNQDLTEEGTISFVIRESENPLFHHKNSNIKFMINKDLGGVLLTILKEKENLIVEIDNRVYGKAKITHNIEEHLGKDTMVFVRWKQDLVKLNLNKDVVEITHTKKGNYKIVIKIDKEVEEIIKTYNVSRDEIEQTINTRDRGIIIKGNPIRIGALHWFNDKIVFAIGAVTKSHPVDNKIYFSEINIALACTLKEELPYGKITNDMSFDEILHVITDNFGLPVQVENNGEFRKLHIDSKWDEVINVDSDDKNEKQFYIQGSFSPNDKKCWYVFAFSDKKYTNWLKKNSQL